MHYAILIAHCSLLRMEDNSVGNRRDANYGFESDNYEPKPDAEVGITNKPLDEENYNEEITEARKRGQDSGDIPVGTHQGITRDEQVGGTLKGVDAGSEAERGADNANQGDDPR